MSNKCPYCNKKPRQVTGKEIYPKRKDLYPLVFWLCEPCGAYVGCHKDSKNKPLGTLANSTLRKLRSECHDEFDFLWKEKLMPRNKAYVWMPETLNIPEAKCHIGMFGEKECESLLLAISQAWEQHLFPFLIGDKFEMFLTVEEVLNSKLKSQLIKFATEPSKLIVPPKLTKAFLKQQIHFEFVNYSDYKLYFDTFYGNNENN